MCASRFGAVRDALAGSLDKDDVGASVAVFLDGEPVVDLWGGYADADRTVPWRRDTITNVWSTTKTMVALCALILADRGVLDLAAPVARYWPEFAAAGKENVLVRHVLAHTAGLPDWDEPTTIADMYDWDLVTTRLAAQAPRWEPGTLAGYHSITQGFLVGEIVRRVTGRTIGTFFADEVAGPLGADFHIGLSAEHDSRLALGIPPADIPDPVAGPRAVQNSAGHGRAIRLSDGNSVAFRRAELPAMGGFGNARSVGLVQSVLSNGGAVGGVRLLSPEGCAVARQEQYYGEDVIIGARMRYGMGFGLIDGWCTWGGFGGSIVMSDLDARMTMAYAMNQMLIPDGIADERALGFMIAAHEGLG
jgi:CubicO group peptidase (beta-lactamase class C family)